MRATLAVVAEARARAYVARMTETPVFLDHGRPGVPDLIVPRGVTPFFLPNRPVRGRLVRLGALADALLTRHDQHPAVTAVVGEALALVAALASALKFKGSFSLQAKGDGPVSMLLADCTDAGALRGYAQVNAERLAPLVADGAMPGTRALLGDGYLAFTVDQGAEMERHQGIVAITGDDLAEMALHYFDTSEQLVTRIRLASGRTEAGWRASALVLERIAGAGGIAPDLDEAAQAEAWTTATLLAATATEAELLDDSLSSEQLLFRLFHTEGVAADRPRALAYGCRCSRQRLAGILEGFSADDLDHMAVEGSIVMTCEFCNFDFCFAREDVRGASEQTG
jgi:molecular chaperone Hsp33